MKENSLHQLSTAQEVLLMKLHDGECSRLEGWRARRLLSSNRDASLFMEELERISRDAQELHDEENDTIDLWSRIERRIYQEESAKALLPDRKTRRRDERGLVHSAWIPRLGWGLSGAFITASVGLVMMPTDRYQGTTGTAGLDSKAMTLASAIPEAQPVSTNGIGSRSGVEADWMISGGRLRFISDPQRRDTIIWVKRKKDSPVVRQEMTPMVVTEPSPLGHPVRTLK